MSVGALLRARALAADSDQDLLADWGGNAGGAWSLSRTWPSASTSAQTAWRSRAKVALPTLTTGRARPNTSSATIAPSASISSVCSSTRAEGPLPLSMTSISTLLPVQEPRPLGMASTLPVMICPLNGWWRSITSPLVGATPPQKLSAVSLNSTGPRADPEVSASPWMVWTCIKKFPYMRPQVLFFQGGWRARVAISSKRREPSGQVPGAQ